MASGLRQARVSKQDLPAVIKIGEDSFGYLVRYRTISEDRNRFSSWSNVYEVPVFDLDTRPATVTGQIIVNGNAVQVIWDDAAERPQYDVFVQYNEEGFKYHGTSPIHSYSFLKEQRGTEEPPISIIGIAIQVESINKERSDALTILDTNVTI